ncbi:histidine kinase [Micromonospora sp. WMMD1120]|uniref:sensor histidine kinase n=1 Tax=Micromonospora sp. WMMD1120 TaxID=3016106 RepID=UPI0024160591|nr:histidine kinase [Micromonospora sp. WMMD1120]MDG4810852.1 histidine kinase [Micromonospora sp. WMMD1120]
MRRLAWVGVGVVTVLAPWYGQPAALRATAWIVVLAATLAISSPRLPRVPLAAAAAVVSLGGSLWAWRFLGYGFVDPGNDSSRVLLWTTVEVGALAALAVVVARTAGRLAGVLLLPGVAIGFRLLPDAALGVQLFLGALGAVAVLAGALLGHYLRGLDELRVAAVRQARSAQRRTVAADLHDYVAHDIAGIAVLAQSARLVAESDPGATLEQVEQAATRALRRLDHSIRLLRDDEERAARQYGLAEVVDLVDVHPLPVELTVALTGRDDVPAAIQATAYRVVSEALTNVARHARPDAPVRVAVTRRDRQLDIVVANDLPPHATPPPASGSGGGLASLRARVEALDGAMRAGVQNGSWQVRVTLPIG